MSELASESMNTVPRECGRLAMGVTGGRVRAAAIGAAG